jgi:hypothetical protein
LDKVLILTLAFTGHSTDLDGLMTVVLGSIFVYLPGGSIIGVNINVVFVSECQKF